MAKGNMTIRMEPELKAQAAALFKSLGMDLSTATGIFYRQALRCHGLPFEVKVRAECCYLCGDGGGRKGRGYVWSV